LVGEEFCELGPRRVLDALGKTSVPHHPVDRRVFNSVKVKDVDETTTGLVGEIASTPANRLTHTGHHLPSARPLCPSGAFGAVLAHPLPHFPRCHLRVLSLDLLGELGTGRPVGVHRYLMCTLGFGQCALLLAQRSADWHSFPRRDGGRRLSPTSMPARCLVDGNGTVAAQSYEKVTYRLPLLPRMVAVLGVYST